MSNEEKNTGVNTSTPQQNNNNENKPQSYGTESVQRELNPSKPLSYGTVMIVNSKTYKTR